MTFDTLDIFQKPTATEEKVMQFLKLDNLSISDISLSLGITTRTVYKHLRNLKKKGIIEDYKKHGAIKGGKIIQQPETEGFTFPVETWRYHALHFIIKPYYFYPRYETTRKKFGNYGITYENWTFIFYPESVRVQLRENNSFDDIDIYKATEMAQEDFNRILFLAGNKFGFEVFKQGKANIRLVNQHIAKTPSKVADATKQVYILIKGEDGKIWFTIDKSLGIKEHEYVHPEKCIDDAEKIERYFNDWRNNAPLTNSELQSHLETILKIQVRYAEAIEKHLETVDKIGKGIDKIGENMDAFILEIRKNNAEQEQKSKKKIYIKGNAQTKLNMFR